MFITATLSLLKWMYFSVEILDHDPCVLRRELIGFSLKEGHDWTEENSGTDFNSSLGLSPEGKILFQHDTVLDRHMVGVQMAVILSFLNSYQSSTTVTLTDRC